MPLQPRIIEIIDILKQQSGDIPLVRIPGIYAAGVIDSLDDIVEHYNSSCRVTQYECGTKSGQAYILILKPHSPNSISALRTSVTYEQVPFITPVYDEGTILTDQLTVDFETGALRQVTTMAKKHELTLARKSESGFQRAYKVPRADDTKTLILSNNLQRYCGHGINSISPNFTRII